ncbi:sporulation histidine kinase inhibitor Sda [Niallia sp. 03133]|uniref:sporulation histidine kinase inhibitor Sda n=1 Tax=Niallia sp. 03133 TaxID=3458060 RepID=UPI004044896B
MSGIKNLSNAELLQAYQLAISLNLEKEFIEILMKEINKRNIKRLQTLDSN